MKTNVCQLPGKLVCLLLLLLPLTSHAADARFISQLVPESVTAGEQFTVVLQYRNTSSRTWQQNDGTVLQSLTRRTWGTREIKMMEKKVRRGEIATFQAKLVAPRKGGTYDFRWQIKSNREGWRGPRSPKLRVVVKAANPSYQSEFVIQKLTGLQKGNEFFAILKRGQVYPVTLIFKNQGRKPWRADDIGLHIKHRQDVSVWSIKEVGLKDGEVIAPGEVKAFHFKIIAPLKPGIYPFQWQLKRGPSWFGAKSDKVTITVQ
jgi:hypothetical protein